MNVKNIKWFFIAKVQGCYNYVAIDINNKIVLKKRKKSDNTDYYDNLIRDWFGGGNKNLIDLNTFEYPIVILRKDIINDIVFQLISLIIMCLVCSYVLLKTQRIISFVIALSFFLLMHFISLAFLLVKVSNKDILLKFELISEKISIVFFNGKIFLYSIDDIKKCCLDTNSINPFIVFKDGVKINRLNQLSYWFILSDKIEKKLKLNKQFETLMCNSKYGKNLHYYVHK